MTSQQNEYRILIVDDVPKNIQIVANVLKKEGYHMAFAKDGERALSLAKQNLFDLILLDIMMPGMDGYAVCKELKKNGMTRETPVIFLTAKTDQDSIIEGFEAGAVDYVTKPFNTRELIARVKTHLNLKKVTQKLENANQTKDMFFSIIAHDLKSPFNAILGFTELLINNYDRYDDEKRLHFIDRIRQSARSTYNLLENLLEWSRYNTGRIEPSPDAFDLSKTTTNVCSLLLPAAQNKDIAMKNHVPEKTIVYADKDMVMFVIRNLLANAVKFTRKGGKVEIYSNSCSHMVEVTVKDTGVGISEKERECLFTMGSTISREGTQGEKGTGLGLMLSSEFVRISGGEIRVVSEMNNGSEFIFTLPRPAINHS